MPTYTAYYRADDTLTLTFTYTHHHPLIWLDQPLSLDDVDLAIATEIHPAIHAGLDNLPTQMWLILNDHHEMVAGTSTFFVSHSEHPAKTQAKHGFRSRLDELTGELDRLTGKMRADLERITEELTRGLPTDDVDGIIQDGTPNPHPRYRRRRKRTTDPE